MVEGYSVQLPGNGTVPPLVPYPSTEQAMLFAPAERMDVIVDFSNLEPGTVVRMINTGPDAPFGGFPIDLGDLAYPVTTGQVMEFVVTEPDETPPTFTDPTYLKLKPRTELTYTNSRTVTLNEEESSQVCVEADEFGEFIIPITQIESVMPGDNFLSDCEAAHGVPFAPKAALLGVLDNSDTSVPLLWMDPFTELPVVGDTEEWVIKNFTADAHPIHLHLVQFQVINREVWDSNSPNYDPNNPNIGYTYGPYPYETGWKDTVVVYPGEIARIKAKFDIVGLYVWHCHILEHEDNEMMRPYFVRPCDLLGDLNWDGVVNQVDFFIFRNNYGTMGPVLTGDLNNDGVVNQEDFYIFRNQYGSQCVL